MRFNKKIYFFVGTTTELIKLAPIIRELEKRKIKFKIITSGQTNVKFNELAFLIKKEKADITLGEKQNRSSIVIFFLWSIVTIFKTGSLKKEFKGLNKNNSYFIVHGDPVSSLIGAIVAKIHGLKLVHVESGLRSFNFLEPFPEEICRVLISKMADIHFAPNEWSIGNLKGEKGEKVNTFNNTIAESYYLTTQKGRVFESELSLGKKKYFVLIMHRQEHVIFGKEKSEKLLKFVLDKAEKTITCVFVTHALAQEFLKTLEVNLTDEQKKKIKIVSRVSYVNFVNLMDNAEFLVTDGGSNQEEAYYMGLPCLLLRDYTERIEGLDQNVVLSKGDKKIIKEFMQNYKKYRREKVKYKTRPAKIIVDFLVKN